MNLSKKTVSAFAATALTASGLFLTQALLPTSAQAAPTSADKAFVVANEQSNLAEITLGPLGRSRGQDAATKDLATTTLSDHMTAKTKLTAAATSVQAPLPAAPNAMQKTAAAQLMAAPAGSFDLMYAQSQVSAHKQALAGAQLEQRTTKMAALKSYTKFYIGIATMHLQMAQDEVAALGGPPTTVPAGNGGMAATDQSAVDNTVKLIVGFGGSVLLIVAGIWVGARRRHTTSD